MADGEQVRILKKEGVEAWNDFVVKKREQQLTWTADLSESNFFAGDLRGAELFGARLELAHLSSVDLREANLEHARLFGANLWRARLQGAVLRNADLSFARLSHADLKEANLEGVRGFVADSCQISGARFGFNAKDPWSRLRRRYSGPALLFNLILLTLFIVPYLIRTVMWVGVNKSQESLERGAFALQEAAIEIETHDPGAARNLRQAALELSATKPCLEANCQERPLWRLVLGFDKGPGYVSLVALLLVYNLGRLFLTRQVAPLRDDEERSQVTPAKKDYWRLHLVDKWVVTPLAWGAGVAFLVNAYIWLVLTTVWVPA